MRYVIVFVIAEKREAAPEKDDRNCEKRRLIFREASSFDNSFYVFSRKWLFGELLRSFFQEADFF